MTPAHLSLISQIQSLLDKMKEEGETKEYPKGILSFYAGKDSDGRDLIFTFEQFAYRDKGYDAWVEHNLSQSHSIFSVKNSSGEVLEVGMETSEGKAESIKIDKGILFIHMIDTEDYSERKVNVDYVHPIAHATYETEILSKKPLWIVDRAGNPLERFGFPTSEWDALFTKSDAAKVSTVIKLLNIAHVFNEGKNKLESPYIWTILINEDGKIHVGQRLRSETVIKFERGEDAERAISLLGEKELIEFFR